MWLHAARLPARVDSEGNLQALFAQDRSSWDHQLLAEGLALFERSASGDVLTAYHIEAAIAAVHAGATSVETTDWITIVELYDRLMNVAPSPIIALNRAIAIAQRDGAECGLHELLAIQDRDRLAQYPFYNAAIAELELQRGDHEGARVQFQAALDRSRNAAERRFLEKRLERSASRGPRP
jgi:RNA polymerase sigma-70 factor (ECF subfamily)